MLTQERLKELLSYDPETGVFRWLTHSGRATSGDKAGSLSKGYLYISVDKQKYLAHRLAWLYINGSWPTKDIDHRDTDSSNNRFFNLREATKPENLRNVGLRSHNASGFKGVHFNKAAGKFQAGARLNGKYNYLGCFTTAELASEAYQAFAKANHGDFYNA